MDVDTFAKLLFDKKAREQFIEEMKNNGL